MNDKPPGPGTTHPHHQSFWLWVMCLTGVDYFSTLGYQPSIAFAATGLLTPFATLLLVLVTLFGALPIYAFVAGKSPHGQGSIGMLAHLLSGWPGKIMVLVLLGFAATDFVITKTLSAADAAAHLIANPIYDKHTPWWMHSQMGVTMLLLVVLGAVFLRGFREVISLAVVIVGVYLVLNLVIVGNGLWYLAGHEELVNQWLGRVRSGDWHLDPRETPLTGGDGLTILLVCLLLFPKLALGLSGFETGVAVMGLVKGRPDDDPQHPQGRIGNTRKLLITAAVIMSFFLLGSSLVVSTLINPAELAKGGRADNRALAFLAHGEAARDAGPEKAPDEAGPAPGTDDPAGRVSYRHDISPLFGEVFGTVYDLSTIVILWFAGASAMAGLLNLVPQYLPRYGMAPDWAQATRPLVLLLTAINLVVTAIFRADVDAQGDAYATGVLVLITSACVATVIEKWRSRTGSWVARVPWYSVLVCLVFFYTTARILYEKTVGLEIASCFIAAIIVSSLVSRAWRSTEMRFEGFRFKDEQSQFLWNSMRLLEIPVLVPHRPGGRALATKEESIRREHRLAPDVPIVFLEVELGDTSDFYQQPLMSVTQEGERFILRVSQCTSIAHVIATIGLELSKHGTPPEIHFGWSSESPLAANLDFLLFGEGNVPWLVRELVLKAEPHPERQPRVVIG